MSKAPMSNASKATGRTQIAGLLRAVLAAAALLAAALAMPAQAELADRDKPVNLEADRVDIDDAKKIAVFDGKGGLTQGTLVIRGDKMVVKQDQDGFQYGTTFGNLASFRQKREGLDEYVEGWAERIEYDGKADRVQLFPRAQMKRGNDDVRGNYISYEATTDLFQVVAGASRPPPATTRTAACAR